LRVGRAIATFFNHIEVVVCCGAEEEVFGVTAGGVIAVVADEHSGWNGSVGKGVNYPVGLLVVSVEPEEAVTVGIFAAEPFETTGVGRGLGYLGVELFKGVGHVMPFLPRLQSRWRLLYLHFDPL